MGLFVDVLVIDFPDEFAYSTVAHEEYPGTQPGGEPIDQHGGWDYDFGVVRVTSLYDLTIIMCPESVIHFESESFRECDTWGTIGVHEHEFENWVLRICGHKCMRQYAFWALT